MRRACNKKMWAGIQKAICFLIFLLFMAIAHAANSNNSQIKTSELPEEDFKIKTQPSLNEQINKQSPNPQIIEIFNSTLFDKTFFETNTKKSKHSPLIWLQDLEIKEKRSKIIGSKQNTFEAWWKISSEAYLLRARTDYAALIRSRINTKIITQFTDSLLAKAEFELFTSSGSIQQIYQRLGETNGISQREILFSWKATNWLTVQFGAVNQGFLQSPLLLANIPFPSIVENIELFKGEEHDVSFSIQEAIPTTFSDKHSIYTQSLAKIPFLITGSLFWNYDPKSYYKITLNSTVFHYNPLPSDIAQASKRYGNSVFHQPSVFKYRYTGFYIGLEPSFQIFPNLGVKIKIHYIHNARETADNYNQGELYSLQIPFDITENIRITSVFEYFKNQPDSSVAYYNSERYGHSNRTGFVGELIMNFYNRNIEVGFRHLRSTAVKEKGSLNNEQTYYLLFLRTNYANI